MTTGTGFSGEVVEYYARYRRGYPDAVVQRIVDAFALTQDDVALDLGCGTGQLTYALAGRVGTMIGMDPEPDMLAAAAAGAATHPARGGRLGARLGPRPAHRRSGAAAARRAHGRRRDPLDGPRHAVPGGPTAAAPGRRCRGGHQRLPAVVAGRRLVPRARGVPARLDRPPRRHLPDGRRRPTPHPGRPGGCGLRRHRDDRRLHGTAERRRRRRRRPLGDDPAARSGAPDVRRRARAAAACPTRPSPRRST